MSVIPPVSIAPVRPLDAEPRGDDAAVDARRVAELRAVSEAFEAAFLQQMLQHTGLGRTPEAFGGGPGEEAFASLMVEQQAKDMAARGGLGVAEHVFAALLRREEGNDA
ncbi:MAG: hypothetical protein EA355_11755 [Rhodobacteraceae bacterium]|nr:MAG: hypothetical protein EA355_11755 [Paracoccaceae bacterium]